MEECSRVLIRMRPPLCGYLVVLSSYWKPRINVATVEQDARIPEDEVHGAVNITFSEYLCVGMREQCVLVSLETATVECRLIGCTRQGDRLAFRRSGCILNREIHSDKIRPIQN